MTRLATMTTPSEGRTITVVGDIYRFLAVGEETEGRYATWEAIVLPGGGPPPHTHSREEESFYVLEGEITFQVGKEGEAFVARAGTFVNMPIGIVHAFKNEIGTPAKMIISVVPAGLENMFFEVGQPATPDTTTASLPTKAEIEKLLAAAPQYGLQIMVPQH